jgi:hypothetical protein
MPLAKPEPRLDVFGSGWLFFDVALPARVSRPSSPAGSNSQDGLRDLAPPGVLIRDGMERRS